MADSRVGLHHLEIWLDAAADVEAWNWLLARVGARRVAQWPVGVSWELTGGGYLSLEWSTAVEGGHQRMRAGLNHLALTVVDDLDLLRAEAGGHGWRELFGDRYPHAGGTDHRALFLESDAGFEVELVAADRSGVE